MKIIDKNIDRRNSQNNLPKIKDEATPKSKNLKNATKTQRFTKG